jgi:hypothetical protein
VSVYFFKFHKNISTTFRTHVLFLYSIHRCSYILVSLVFARRMTTFTLVFFVLLYTILFLEAPFISFFNVRSLPSINKTFYLLLHVPFPFLVYSFVFQCVCPCVCFVTASNEALGTDKLLRQCDASVNCSVQDARYVFRTPETRTFSLGKRQLSV